MCATAGGQEPGSGLWTFLPSLARVGQCSGGLRPDGHNQGGPPRVDAEREDRGVGPQEPQNPDRGALWAHQRTLHRHQDSLA